MSEETKEKEATENSILERLEVDESENFQQKLVVYNDDVNTFEHVILCLVKYVQLNFDDAQDYTMQVHNEGSCTVKRAKRNVLLPMRKGLTMNGIDARIEDGGDDDNDDDE